MKNKLTFLLLILFFMFSKSGYSQQPSLLVYYTVSEKSKDSHSRTEKFSLTGQVLAYSVKFTGRKGPGDKDESRIIRLSNDQVSSVNNLISKYKLNVPDSLVEKPGTETGFSNTTTIIITISQDGKITRVKVQGDPAAMEDKTLYANAAFLVGTIRQMINSLHE